MSSFSGVWNSEALCSRLCRDIICVDDSHLNYHGSTDARKSRHVAEVAKGMLSIAGGLLLQDDVDVDIWGYWNYVERPYVKNLCDLPAEQYA